VLPGQCLYVPIVDETGGMLNDPVAVKLAEDRWWISIADSDLLFWVKAVAHGWRLDVLVEEPDVSPLAVQGPKADDLMARVFGEAVREVRFFRFGQFAFEGRWLVVARSGYSKQGGYEIYVEGSDLGMPLWHALMEAGRDLDVRAGCPNLIERIESGLLSYGNDMTRENTPHECGLGRFCNTQTAIGCIGRDALLRVAMEGPVRQIRPIAIAGGPVPPCVELWPVTVGGKPVGRVSSAVWSPDFGTNVAIGMVRMTHWDPGTALTVETPDGPREAVVQETFWN
jgi:Glycine cleavage system T protein (aminomethyltransferase)